MPPSHIAVLGGGISGLTAAYHLAQRFPNTLISVIEKDTRWGGWIRSERLKVIDQQENKASVLLESGPRTLNSPTKTRSNSAYVLELAHQLGLHKDIITAPPATRYLYNEYHQWDGRPVRHGLTPIPTSFADLFRTDIGRVILPVLLDDAVAWKGIIGYDLSQTRNLGGGRFLHGWQRVTDLSLQHYLDFRFGTVAADLLGSALAHVAYAADPSRLGVEGAFPELLKLDWRGKGSAVRGLALWRAAHAVGRPGERELARRALDTGGLLQRLRGTGVFSFREGLGTLVRGLVEALGRNENVRLLKGCEVTELVPWTYHYPAWHLAVKAHGKGTRLPNVNSPPVTHVFSSLPPATTNGLVLKPLLEMARRMSEPLTQAEMMPFKEEDFPRTSVAVVNLVFPPSGQALHPPGLGYVMPRPSDGYEGGDGSGVLGVTFDSYALAEQDYALPAENNAWGSSPFTKMTAMLGGPFPLTRERLEPAHVVAKIEEQMMYYELPKPVLARVHLHKECIPMYKIGHALKTEELIKYWARDLERLVHIGADIAGVGVDDCIGVARGAAIAVKWD